MSFRFLGYPRLPIFAPVVQLRQLYQSEARAFVQRSHTAATLRSQPAPTPQNRRQTGLFHEYTVSCTRPHTPQRVPFPQHQRTVRAAFPSSSIVVGFVLLLVSIPILNHIYGQEEKNKSMDPVAALTMSQEVLPGRPGTLTAEEELKLRELWQLCLRLFGVADPKSEIRNTDGAEIATTAPAAIETIADPAKRKRGRLGFFRRKLKEDEMDETASISTSGTSTPISTDAIANGVGANDKYGLAKAFKDAIANTTPEEIRAAFWDMVKHDHPDALFLRFLRARKWDVNAAAVMAVSALHWRLADAKVDSDVMLRGELGMLELTKSSDAVEQKEGNDFMDQIRMGKSFLHGVDKEGRPCCFVRVRLHRPGEQSESSLERFTVYTIETARIVLRPPVDTAVSILRPFVGSPVPHLNMLSDHCFRHDRLFPCQHGLCSCQIYDQMLRSKLSRITRYGARPQITLDLSRYLENHSRLARPRRRQ